MSMPFPCRVLIVDDNQVAADILVTLVRLLGHEVTAAYNGVSAVEIAQAFKPDVILLDLVMPQVDGFTVAKQLRELNVRARIIALTAFTQPAFIETAEASGFDGFVAKPATAEQLAGLLVPLVGQQLH